MASLIQVRDMLALQGRMEAKQLSLSLHTPQPMIDAMLERLEAMGKAVRIRRRQRVASLAVVKVVRKERLACGSGGHCANTALIKPGIAARLYHITYRRPRWRVRFWSVFLHW